ncbi:hypothetical protein N431DRAFT_450043 [Stipitochalara longipes BDJ]|nr:hypothetical protein N431DRAFT_450043 [Stipitochalara longipes BDJ]
MSQRGPPVPQMQQPPGTYTPQQHSQLTAESHNAGPENLTAATDYVTQIFRANGIPYALMGGFALKLRGNTRNTYDVDLAVGCDMSQLIAVLASQNRLLSVLRPFGPVSGVMRIFVRTGGSLGTPLNPQTASENLNVTTPLGPRQYTFLTMPHMIRMKLGAFCARQGDNDYNDIVWLIRSFTDVVVATRPELSETHRRYFVHEYSRRNRGPANYGNVIYVKNALDIQE